VERSARLHPLCSDPQTSWSPPCFRVNWSKRCIPGSHFAGFAPFGGRTVRRPSLRSWISFVKSHRRIHGRATRHMVAHVTAGPATCNETNVGYARAHTYVDAQRERERERLITKEIIIGAHAPRGLTIGLPPPHPHLLPPILWSPPMHASRICRRPASETNRSGRPSSPLPPPYPPPTLPNRENQKAEGGLARRAPRERAKPNRTSILARSCPRAPLPDARGGKETEGDGGGGYKLASSVDLEEIHGFV